MSKQAIVAARVLVAVLVQGVQLKPEQLAMGPQDLIDQLHKNGTVDKHKDAVAYARSQGAQVVEIQDDATLSLNAARAQAQASLETAHAALAANTDEARAATLAAAVEAAKKQLEALA